MPPSASANSGSRLVGKFVTSMIWACLLALAGCSRGVSPQTSEVPATAEVSHTGSPGSKANPAPTGGIPEQPENLRANAGEEVAILAGGCFWGMEEILRKIPGVLATEAGYAGGEAGVKYEDVHSGATGNAEAVRIRFNPQQLSYEDLLSKWFFRMHDPTTKNRQGNDVGSQYRSAIFVTSKAQRDVAEQVKRRIDKSGVWKAPIVTEISDASSFTRAEDYHQGYLQRVPNGYTCHFMRDLPMDL
jgi:methionine-S-sulfoxide reductase